MLQQGEKLNEPTLVGKVHQIQESLTLAENRVAALRSHLWGWSEGEAQELYKQPSTVDGLLIDISRRLASLCGELATINECAGCVPEPDAGKLLPLASNATIRG